LLLFSNQARPAFLNFYYLEDADTRPESDCLGVVLVSFEVKGIYLLFDFCVGCLGLVRFECVVRYFNILNLAFIGNDEVVVGKA